MSERDNSLRSAPVANWGVALIVACLGMGFSIGWAVYEQRYMTQEHVAAQRFRIELDVAMSRESDLGQLIADSRTRVVRLNATTLSNTRGAAIAWNQERGRGALFCSGLSPSINYSVNLRDDTGRDFPILLGPAAQGATVLQFGTQPGFVPTVRTIILSETDTAAGAEIAKRVVGTGYIDG